MAVQADVKDALEGDRADLVRVLADHRLVPTPVDRGGSDLLDRSTSPTVTLDPQSEEAGNVDRQTTVRVVDALGLDSEEACEAVAEEIRNHEAWD